MTPTSLPHYLERQLDGLKPSGNQWIARCVLHDDNDPSMTLRVTADGTVLVHCHAGCDQRALAQRLGLHKAQDDGEWTPRGPAVAVYPYVDEIGTLLFEVCRTADHQFPQRRPDPSAQTGQTWNLNGVRRVLFRLPQLIEAVGQGKSVCIAEGEKDVLALVAHGKIATCNPGGAGKWHPEYCEHFRDADVTIFADKDKRGQKHARDIATKLQGIASRIWIVEAADPHKDIAAHLCAGLPLSAVIAWPADPVSAASPVHISGSVALASGQPTVVDLFRGLRSGGWLDAQEFPPLRYAVPGIVPEGSTLLVGAPKIGKSWFVLGLALAKAAGGIALGGVPVDPAPTFYLALEDGDRRMQSRCRMLLGDSPIPDEFEYMTRVQPGRVIDTISAWVARHPGEAPVVILDTLGKVMPSAAPGESSYQRDYRIGSALKAIADGEPGMSLITNHHDRKANSDDFVDAVSGTHGLAGAADTVMVLNRPRHETKGLLLVTGRDVVEGQYAMRVDDGRRWALDGGDLAEAAQRAGVQTSTAGLGERSTEIVALVNARPEGITVTDLGKAIGIEATVAGTYLLRLMKAGKIKKFSRGVYGPIGTSVESVESVETGRPPVSIPNFNTFDTFNTASARDGEAALRVADAEEEVGEARPDESDVLPIRVDESTAQVLDVVGQVAAADDLAVPTVTQVDAGLGRAHCPPDPEVPTTGNPTCRVCGRDRLYSAKSIERGICARCDAVLVETEQRP